jgi:hypothetical protein
MTIVIDCLHCRYLRTLGADPLTSPRRIDYYDDPDASKASTLVPSVNVVVINCTGEILLILRGPY